MDKNQRDYYLHEQLNIISSELGEGDDTHAEAEDYRRRILELHLAEDSEQKLLKEVDRLAKMQGSNQEATVIRTYLDTCLDLPWNTFTEDDLDIVKAQEILDRDHYGLKKVKDRILEMLAVRKLAPDVKAQIICLVGPPGVGKTSIARSIAACLHRKYVRLSLGGVRDEAEIRGHRRTYIGAMPGKIISAMITAKSQNPLILLDEIDKLAGDFRGDPAAALLEALDPEQNNTFIPAPLRDRMDIIELPSYTRVEKYNIARRHLLPKQLELCGLTGKVTVSQSALYGLIDGYTREAGVRSLERTITSVLRKCARKIAAGETESVSVTAAMLEELLGPRMVKPEFLNRDNAVGIANGLAWTSVGGETLPIEVQVIEDGAGKITVTGSLGDVMKESAQLAVTYARVHAAEYGARRGRPQRRAVGRRHPDHRPHLLPVRAAGAGGCGHDRRDHPARLCAAHRRPAGKEHGRLPRGDEAGPHPQGQRERPVRGRRRGQGAPAVHAGLHPQAGAGHGAAQARRKAPARPADPDPQVVLPKRRGHPAAALRQDPPARGGLLNSTRL